PQPAHSCQGLSNSSLLFLLITLRHLLPEVRERGPVARRLPPMELPRTADPNAAARLQGIAGPVSGKQAPPARTTAAAAGGERAGPRDSLRQRPSAVASASATPEV
ncbi:unnamed protein product, partial [Ectocarpus sp. 13 AM-2016]